MQLVSLTICVYECVCVLSRCDSICCGVSDTHVYVFIYTCVKKCLTFHNPASLLPPHPKKMRQGGVLSWGKKSRAMCWIRQAEWEEQWPSFQKTLSNSTGTTSALGNRSRNVLPLSNLAESCVCMRLFLIISLSAFLFSSFCHLSASDLACLFYTFLSFLFSLPFICPSELDGTSVCLCVYSLPAAALRLQDPWLLSESEQNKSQHSGFPFSSTSLSF